MTNKKQATKKSIQESKVQQLDDIGSDINSFLQEESLSVIESVLGDFILRVQENINNEEGMVTTGKINQIELQADGNYINVIGNKHLIYQDRGVNGRIKQLYDTPHQYTNKMPPVDVFKQWIKDKNIRLEYNEKYGGNPSTFAELSDEDKINKAAWGMAMKVYNEGFKPRNIYSKEIPKLVEDLENEIANFTIQTINQVIDVKPSAQRTIVK